MYKSLFNNMEFLIMISIILIR